MLWNKYQFYHCICCLYVYFLSAPWLLEYLIAVFAVNIEIFALDWDLFTELSIQQLVHLSFLVMETMLSLVLNSWILVTRSYDEFSFSEFRMMTFTHLIWKTSEVKLKNEIWRLKNCSLSWLRLSRISNQPLIRLVFWYF